MSSCGQQRRPRRPLPGGIAVDLLGVVAGHQAGPRRPAAGGVVHLREAQAAGGQPIEVGRGDLAAVAADVGEAHVVGQDEHDVGRRGRAGFGGRRSAVGGRRWPGNRGAGDDQINAHRCE